MTATHTRPDGTTLTLGDVGQVVVFDNDRVRVWEIVLQPGASVSWHHHEHDYLVIALQPADNRIDAADGGVRHVHETTGGVVFRPAGEVHMLTNEGSTPYRSRLVELLETPQGER